MFENALEALRAQKERVLEQSRQSIAEIDREIALLESQSGSPSSKAKNGTAVKTSPGEFSMFEDLWPAIKTVLTRHQASSHNTGLAIEDLIKELNTGGALTRYKPNFAARVPLITLGQHKDEGRYDLRTKKAWLVNK